MEKEGYQHVKHEFGPVYNEQSQVLILGSFPSVKSRQQQFYYGHPQNRFWKVIAAVTETPEAETISNKKKQLLENGIAVWDVIASCDIIGSSDSSIKNVAVNDLSVITSCAELRAIYANGDKAYRLFMKYLADQTNVPVCKLPSTSPANAACSLAKLIQAWSVIRET